jgi:tRNA-Thr(GGU) m(6)t(6)A37 methyltransferase TsaA
MFEFNPIGYVRNSQREMYQLPFQVGILPDMNAEIHLERGQNFEPALPDLEGVERIWVIFAFHKAMNWKPKISPPRGGGKRGLFATRSPHRPNPIGMSAVKLLKIDGLKLIIEDHDLLDGTPVLDIKPYLPYVDSYPQSNTGWLEDVALPDIHEISWSEKALDKARWLRDKAGVDLSSLVSVNLKLKPYPEKGNRIKKIGESCEIAVKTWRLSFILDGQKVILLDVYSGYSEEYLSGDKVSRWDDIALHKEFIDKFPL